MKTGIIVQARMGSTRLKGKVMKDLCGRPVIDHVIERLRQCKNVSEIIIATTDLPQDDIIVRQAEKNLVRSFRGSEDDVLSRYYNAAREYGLDVIARVTSDCPLIDPFIIDELVGFFLENDYDMVANVSLDLSRRTYPRGLDAEVFSFSMLETAFNNASQRHQREHVTPYIYEYGKKVFCYKNSENLSRYRWTLDTDDDFKLIEFVYKNLYNGKHNFYFNDISALFEKHPEMAAINAHVEQKKIN